MSKIKSKSILGDFTLWEKQEIERIQGLSDRKVLRELRSIMRGESYSWSNISQQLQRRLDAGFLELEHFESGNIIYEWNVLCDEKIYWENYKHPSFTSFRFNKDCLIKLKVIPTQAGLGPDGK
jgi:hypothetical protein